MEHSGSKSSQANALIHESSPYLLQHAYNPVHWEAWSQKVLDRAKSENKIILLSIGYSACHWCHVMEHECFEDEEVASLQNSSFVNIKVDREERPDVDQVYMDAVQAMGMRGGWPLNVFLLPDGRPFYGGTYFPKPNWINVLKGVQRAFTEEYDKVLESAAQLTESLQRSEVERYRIGSAANQLDEKAIVKTALRQLAEKGDRVHGGLMGAPKFPMPCIYDFMLKGSHFTPEAHALELLETTLKKMALGGMYDQVGGGFARYSVDEQWFIPHFEKMLYDNGQLLSLYANANRKSPKPMYERVIRQTIEWLQREMLAPEGAFYAALDADSEGEEGKFYCFTAEELDEVWAEKAASLSSYYRCTPEGNWEHGRNVLFPISEPEVFALKNGIEEKVFLEWIRQSNRDLLNYRTGRIRPGLDHKILCSWNALTISGLCDSYKALSDPLFLELALNAEAYIDKHLLSKNGSLYRCLRKNAEPIPAFLEDYAATMQAYTDLYETTFDEVFLLKAKLLFDFISEHFYDREEGYFHFSAHTHGLIANKKELFDNVIPSPNSIIANTCFRLGRIIGDTSMISLAEEMLHGVAHLVETEPRYMTNWAALMCTKAWSQGELVISTPDETREQKSALLKHYAPGLVLARANNDSAFALLQGKNPIAGKPTYYLCEQGACQKPVYILEEVWEQISFD